MLPIRRGSSVSHRGGLTAVSMEPPWWWLLLLASGVLWMPVPWGFRRFEDPLSAESFLQALWQVHLDVAFSLRL